MTLCLLAMEKEIQDLTEVGMELLHALLPTCHTGFRSNINKHHLLHVQIKDCSITC